jgi:hypothetical protein
MCIRHELSAAAQRVGLQVDLLHASNESEIAAAFAAAASRRTPGLVVQADPFLLAAREQIVTLAARYRLPTIYGMREFAIRSALGAGRRRLICQLLTESLILAALGGALGLAVAYGGVRAILALSPDVLPRMEEISVDGRVLGFTALIAIVTGILFGLVPALRSAGSPVGQSLKGGSRAATSGRGSRRLHGALVVAEFALALVVLTGAGLLIRTVHNLARVRPGFDTQNIMTMSITLPNWDGNSMYDFHVRSLVRLSSLPGVRQAAFGWGLPLTGDKWIDFVTIEGQPGTDRLADTLTVAKRSVTPDYFDALGIQIVAGRGNAGTGARAPFEPPSNGGPAAKGASAP